MTDPAADSVVVCGVAAAFREAHRELVADDGIAAGAVARGSLLAWLDFAAELVGPVALVDWLHSSADAIEATLLAERDR